MTECLGHNQIIASKVGCWLDSFALAHFEPMLFDLVSCNHFGSVVIFAIDFVLDDC